jgi:hypothetical protein
MKTAEIHNFTPDLLEEQLALGWCVIPSAVDDNVLCDLEASLDPNSWSLKFPEGPKRDENPLYYGYGTNFHNQWYMQLRQGRYSTLNFLMEGLRQKVQANATILEDEELVSWGNDTWGLTDRIRKVGRKAFPDIFPVSDLERAKSQYSSGVHKIEPGGHVAAHIDGEVVRGERGFNVLLIIDHDPEVDAGLEFGGTSEKPGFWQHVSAHRGDIVLIGKWAWHRYSYPDDAIKPRYTSLFSYHNMGYHLDGHFE